MQDNLEKVFVVLICASFVVLAVPVGATEYSPGVQVGYWVEYRNLVSGGTGNPEDFNATEWMKMEVTLVTGNRVTVHTSRMLMNGTFQDGYDYVFDVATGETDRSGDSSNLWNNYFVVAGNLAGGSDTHLAVVLPEGSAAMFINKTETKDLLGMNRTVNLVDRNASLNAIPDYDYQFHSVYDQTTGMLLELNYSLTSHSIPSTNEVVSYSAAEINTKPKSSDNTLTYTEVAIAVVIIVAVAATLVVRRRRKAHATRSLQEAAKKKTAE
jgi:hypothetical protein